MEKKIRARLIDNPNYGSISVMGMQRIGKSSLAYNLLEGKADQFLEQKMIVFRVSMYQFDSVLHLVMYKDPQGDSLWHPLWPGSEYVDHEDRPPDDA